jgi:hypothetical protein
MRVNTQTQTRATHAFESKYPTHPTTQPPNQQVQLQLKHHYKLQNAFSNPVDCALYTVRSKGALGLYKGLTPWIVFAFPRHVTSRPPLACPRPPGAYHSPIEAVHFTGNTNTSLNCHLKRAHARRSAVRFSTYEYAAQALQGNEGKVDPLYAMLAGTLAGSGTCVYLSACVRARLVVDRADVASGGGGRERNIRSPPPPQKITRSVTHTYTHSRVRDGGHADAVHPDQDGPRRLLHHPQVQGLPRRGRRDCAG